MYFTAIELNCLAMQGRCCCSETGCCCFQRSEVAVVVRDRSKTGIQCNKYNIDVGMREIGALAMNVESISKLYGCRRLKTQTG